MTRLLLIVTTLFLVGNTAWAAPKKKYHFELAAVTVKPEVKADVAKSAAPRVELQVKKALASHPQLVAALDGAPPKSQVDAYRKYLVKKRLAGAFLVTVEVTEASEELVPMDKPNAQRLVVRVGVHILGETIPGRTMGFTGDGQATVKQEVGKKVRERDRQFAWDSAAEVAIADAMTTVFKQLAVPAKKQ
ncbi:MAG: hypothetical protein H0T89_35210 [Deltaproteobacteria bacterium]|nr:hypothetical protein [Deltaproteobacteria bacterium]MDQ3299519.1 hypothetical protein [Myxococcota bacterium]